MTFEYVRPNSLGEAFRLLTEYGPKAKILAGGTDLLLAIRMGKATPRYLIDLSRLAELHGIWATDTGITIGAMTKVREIEISSLLVKDYRILVEAASTLASVQIRHLATIGGNICNASPSADLVPALLVLDAQAEIAGPYGRRTIPLVDFFQGPRQSVLKPTEVLVKLHVPCPAVRSGAVYIKHSLRRAMDLAFIGVANLVSATNGAPDTIRIALGAVAPTPIRARQAEELVLGRGNLNPETIAEAARMAADEAKPIDDVRSSAWYRRRMVEVDTKRALTEAAKIMEERS
ncbi:MAG: dehydrogenase [Chloroflexota bacterium]|nr:MAG: dehydrogenase [Chloroflexota bacterium]